MAVRVALCLVSLAVAGCLAALEHGARAADRVTGLALIRPKAAQLREGEALVRTARRWSPDTDPQLNLALAYARAGRLRASAARARAVTRAEPRNARAWTVLCLVESRYDSGSAATACARERALAPPVPPAR
jgi:hypothetical protein